MHRKKRRWRFTPLSGEQAKRLSRGILLGILLFSAALIFWRTAQSEPQRGPDRAIRADWSNPSVKNSADLVKYAQNALAMRWGYVYGTYGQVLEPELLNACRQKYPDEIEPYLSLTQQKWMGGRVTDCAGLIKGYGWLDPQSGEIRYLSNGMPDRSANGMYQAATEKGEPSSMPEIPGLAVWMNGHIGVYIGGGEVIEAMSSAKGVVKTKMQGRGWLAWLKIPAIQYS